MAKPTLTIDEQIERLKFKKVTFDSIDEENAAKKILLKYNYLNIASLKYFFASGKSAKDHVYRYETSFSSIANNYEKVLTLENELRNGVLSYETEFKVHFTLFLIDFLNRKKLLSFEELLKKLEVTDKNGFIKTAEDEFYDKFKLEWIKGIEKYSGHTDFLLDYHLLIKILSFGTILKLLNFKYEAKNTLYYEFSTTYNAIQLPKKNELETLVILRNSLCHKEGIITFLDKGWRLDYNQTSKRKRNYLSERQKSIEYIFNYNTNEHLNPDCFIIKFGSFRLKNTSTDNFLNMIIK